MVPLPGSASGAKAVITPHSTPTVKSRFCKHEFIQIDAAWGIVPLKTQQRQSCLLSFAVKPVAAISHAKQEPKQRVDNVIWFNYSSLHRTRPWNR